MELADRAVIAGSRDTVLRPAIVDAALEKVLKMLAEPSPSARSTEVLEAELGAVRREIELVSAISAGGDVPALVEGLRARERRRQEVAEQLAGTRQNAPRRFDQAELRAELRQRPKGLATAATIASVRVCTLAVCFGGLLIVASPDGCDGVYDVPAIAWFAA
jgi:hypothetical protein